MYTTTHRRSISFYKATTNWKIRKKLSRVAVPVNFRLQNCVDSTTILSTWGTIRNLSQNTSGELVLTVLRVSVESVSLRLGGLTSAVIGAVEQHQHKHYCFHPHSYCSHYLTRSRVSYCELWWFQNTQCVWSVLYRYRVNYRWAHK